MMQRHFLLVILSPKTILAMMTMNTGDMLRRTAANERSAFAADSV